MAIDAVIERTRETRDGLRLELAPRVEADGQDSIAGQPAMVVLGPRTFEPQVGHEIWGNASVVQVVNGPEYDRKGIRLREKRNCPRCYRQMYWADISNTETGARREVWRCGGCGTEEPLG